MLENTKLSNDNTGSTVNIYGDETTGYWTLSPSNFESASVYAYRVTSDGFIDNNVINKLRVGARPVITVPKTDLSFE